MGATTVKYGLLRSSRIFRNKQSTIGVIAFKNMVSLQRSYVAFRTVVNSPLGGGRLQPGDKGLGVMKDWVVTGIYSTQLSVEEIVNTGDKFFVTKAELSEVYLAKGDLEQIARDFNLGFTTSLAIVSSKSIFAYSAKESTLVDICGLGSDVEINDDEWLDVRNSPVVGVIVAGETAKATPKNNTVIASKEPTKSVSKTVRTESKIASANEKPKIGNKAAALGSGLAMAALLLTAKNNKPEESTTEKQSTPENYDITDDQEELFRFAGRNRNRTDDSDELRRDSKGNFKFQLPISNIR